MVTREMGGPIVFGVGLNKTGTTSLGRACELLGYRPFHHETRSLRSARLSQLVDASVAADEPPFAAVPSLARYDAFFDVRAVEKHFEAIDRAYPDARFILHTRDIGDWLDSREKHVRRNIDESRKTWSVVDRDAWREQFESHHARVRSYFRQRPGDLLEIDVTASPDWKPLCEFLGVPLPGRPFPMQNTAARSTKSKATRATKKLLRSMRIID